MSEQKTHRLYLPGNEVTTVTIHKGGGVAIDLDMSGGWGCAVARLVALATQIAGQPDKSGQIDNILCALHPDYKIVTVRDEDHGNGLDGSICGCEHCT